MSDLGKSILQGATEALEYAKGNQSNTRSHAVKIPHRVNVVLIRDNLHMSRQEFADTFGFSIRTLEKWERGERHPEGPARAYLTVIAKDAKAVMKALSN
jgi:putative transcriptional regulator